MGGPAFFVVAAATVVLALLVALTKGARLRGRTATRRSRHLLD